MMLGGWYGDNRLGDSQLRLGEVRDRAVVIDQECLQLLHQLVVSQRYRVVDTTWLCPQRNSVSLLTPLGFDRSLFDRCWHGSSS